MTLPEQLEKSMKAKNINGKELSKLTGVMAWEISRMKIGGDFRANALKKIANALDDPELLKYVEFKTCLCGKKFIPDREHRRYCSNECRIKYKSVKKAQTVIKASVSFAEYNDRARSQGLSYGQLQGLERLGLR